ncbi:hypothetical protein SPRG_03915 [Saprolegnia parasitica CBS 223.65]|uniref:Uncharacterized protein n=1 Tax=Saprolegnia parasitica (strain CBS 223.65) TaxID=695850 RepID=A0A067CKR2_SAPPC|nr:hypothetical protein SPRG_03915 [Saprolegnia parasitica CBS 223.65]KDO31299.1 hypothetical protein SPRG_03915 [Saprolegnia parasitica CBS 223.65]|eukprot:XP_012197898.1 hypothetical protein SPRG_03915 [Saprolegnia parasitica CBS 223.65]
MEDDPGEMEAIAIQSQITELNRLLFTTSDEHKRRALEQQIAALEEDQITLRKAIQDEREIRAAARFTTVRPASARPRRTTLKPVQEDNEVPASQLTAELARRHFINVIHLKTELVRDVVTPSQNQNSGMYPQLLQLTMRETVYIASIEVTSAFVKEMRVHCTHSRSVVNPDPITVTLPPPADGEVERVSHKFKFEGDAIEAIDIRILSGYEAFCFVHVVKVKIDDNVERKNSS